MKKTINEIFKDAVEKGFLDGEGNPEGFDKMIRDGEIPGIGDVSDGGLRNEIGTFGEPDEDSRNGDRNFESDSVSGTEGIGGNEDKNQSQRKPIGKEQVEKALETLRQYKDGKINLEARIRGNYEWYRARHWKEIRKKGYEDAPASAYLFNLIETKHADMMDNIPTATVLPREASDRDAARKLSAILPCILENNKYDRVYSDLAYDYLVGGTAVHRIVWDNTVMNGVGDISLTRADVLSLFWEPGCEDIQRSPDFFSIELFDNDYLKQKYPILADNPGGLSVNATKYEYDDTVDTSKKSEVIDWYYKKELNGRTILHYCKFCGGEVLFASENEPEYAERGFYDHGKYPFVFTPLYPCKGSPCGFGSLDVLKDTQIEIDALSSAIVKNAKMSARKRYFYRENAGINAEDFADWTKDLIRVSASGNIADALQEVRVQPITGIIMNVLSEKKEELKETGGNRDISNGGVTGGVTTASGIAALQEASNKLSRDFCRRFYTGFEDALSLIIELTRQFYDDIRCFRITGEDGGEEFITYNNREIALQEVGTDAERLPVFDLKVRAMKASPFSRLSQNELALELYQKGIFNPQLADQALLTLDMMDFEGKDAVIAKVQRGQTMFMQLQQAQQQLAQMTELVRRLSSGKPDENRSEEESGQHNPVMPNGRSGDHAELSEGVRENGRVAAARVAAREGATIQ